MSQYWGDTTLILQQFLPRECMGTVFFAALVTVWVSSIMRLQDVGLHAELMLYKFVLLHFLYWIVKTHSHHLKHTVTSDN